MMVTWCKQVFDLIEELVKNPESKVEKLDNMTTHHYVLLQCKC